jgi:PPE-repeat protein
MPVIRSTVILGCSLLGAGAIAMAVPATSSADNCLLGVQGLVCDTGILNFGIPGTQIGIGNSGGFNGGILNSGFGNVGGVNNGNLNQGLANFGNVNQGGLNFGNNNSGLLNANGNSGLLNHGGGSLLGLAPSGHLLGIGG